MKMPNKMRLFFQFLNTKNNLWNRFYQVFKIPISADFLRRRCKVLIFKENEYHLFFPLENIFDHLRKTGEKIFVNVFY